MRHIDEETLKKVARGIFRPALGFCLRHSLKLKEIIELLKLTLVELAQEDLSRQKEQSSISKISLMSGVHRKDVAQLLNSIEPRDMGTSIHMRVVGHWKTNKQFLTSSGKPRPLEVQGKESEFAQLVRSVHKELNPYTVLFELQRSKVAEEKSGFLHLVGQEYVPHGLIEEGFKLVSSDIRDLIVASEHNILDEKTHADPNLHLLTSYDNVPPEAVPEIRAWFMSEGAKLHERARRFLSKFDKDLNPRLKDKSGRARIALGTFSLTEVLEPESADTVVDAKENNAQ